MLAVLLLDPGRIGDATAVPGNSVSFSVKD